jgi:deoxyadenosine/deoxycytidine kinase
MVQPPLDRLIVVAGTTCCGKTNFINQLMSGNLKNFEKSLQMNELNSWFYQDAYYLNKKRINDIFSSSVSKVLLHWTIPLPNFRIFLRNIFLLGKYDKKERLQLIKSSKHLTVLTLFANPMALLHRVKLRNKKWVDELEEKNANFVEKILMLHSIKTVNNFYSDSKRYLPVYTEWFNFVGNGLKPQKHCLIDVNHEPLIREFQDWPDITTQWQSMD